MDRITTKVEKNKETTHMQDVRNLPMGEPQVSFILHLNTDQSGGLPGPISQYQEDMLRTPVTRFEPSLRVGADPLIRHNERDKWQPVSAPRNGARTGVTALRLVRRLQSRTGGPVTLSCQAGRWIQPRDLSRAAQSGSRGTKGQGASTGSIWGPRGVGSVVQAPNLPHRRRGFMSPRAAGGKKGRHRGPLGWPRGFYIGAAGTAKTRPAPRAIRHLGLEHC